MKKALLSLGVSLFVLTGAAAVLAQQTVPTPAQNTQQPPPTDPKAAYYAQMQKQWLEMHPNNRNAFEGPDITQEKVETHPCSKSDIIGGMWKMIYFREDPPRRADKYNRRIKYQYLAFDPTNYYRRVNSAISIDDPNKARKLMAPPPNNDERYAQKYILTEDNANVTEVIFTVGKRAISRENCTIVTKPLDPYKPGDLILKSYADGNAVLFQLYRRWF